MAGRWGRIARMPVSAMSAPSPRKQEEASHSNFIRQIIEPDLMAGKHATRKWNGKPRSALSLHRAPPASAKIRTRLPPEPNRQLHYGHPKSIFLHFGLAPREGGVEESVDLFGERPEGKFAGGEQGLSTKIDMASPNINLRDPAMYRIRHAAHHRTGDHWCIYPTYDWAHGVSAALENITHSLCTLEFEDHRPLYEWFNERLAEDWTGYDGGKRPGRLQRPPQQARPLHPLVPGPVLRI